MKWFSAMPVQVQAALVAAAVTLIVLFFRDLIFRLWEERREITRSMRTVFRSYADPLAYSATSLLWRLHEIFYAKGRAVFLRTEAPRTKYESYKRRSTFYRLAIVIGWLRAFRRELSFVSFGGKNKFREFEDAIAGFESALADGPHVEIERLESLAKLWGVDVPKDNEKRAGIGANLEELIKRCLHKAKAVLATELSPEGQAQLCTDVAHLLFDRLGIDQLPQQVIDETKARAICGIAVEEAWLYRDWQYGIGDLMIREVDKGPRRFDVLGYREFESMLDHSQDDQATWIDRLAAVLDGMDVTGADRFDARVQQLRNTMRATAILLQTLARVGKRRGMVSPATLKIAEKIIQDTQIKGA